MICVLKVRFLLAVFLFCFAFSCGAANSSCQSAAEGAQSSIGSQSNVARTRAEHLRHGINLSEWFAQVYDPRGYTQEHFQAWNTAQDIALIKALGFDHVRLSVNPQPMFRPRQADELPAEYLSQLDAAVKMILDANLAVMIDIHPDSDFKEKLAKEGDFTEQFADFWRGLAHHYSNLDPNLVFFEILNEPEARDAYRWYGDSGRRSQSHHYCYRRAVLGR